MKSLTPPILDVAAPVRLGEVVDGPGHRTGPRVVEDDLLLQAQGGGVAEEAQVGIGLDLRHHVGDGHDASFVEMPGGRRDPPYLMLDDGEPNGILVEHAANDVVLKARGVQDYVYVLRSDCHSGVCNTRALEIAGITRDTPDPAGARFGRYGPSGRDPIQVPGRRRSVLGQQGLVVAPALDPYVVVACRRPAEALDHLLDAADERRRARHRAQCRGHQGGMCVDVDEPRKHSPALQVCRVLRGDIGGVADPGELPVRHSHRRREVSLAATREDPAVHVELGRHHASPWCRAGRGDEALGLLMRRRRGNHGRDRPARSPSILTPGTPLMPRPGSGTCRSPRRS